MGDDWSKIRDCLLLAALAFRLSLAVHLILRTGSYVVGSAEAGGRRGWMG